jgi:molybdopterin converting factor small subunit
VTRRPARRLLAILRHRQQPKGNPTGSAKAPCRYGEAALTQIATEILVRIRSFAQLRELLGSEIELHVRRGATLADLWTELCGRSPGIADFASTTRIARNGRVAALLEEEVADGDEIALLPPVGGG